MIQTDFVEDLCNLIYLDHYLDFYMRNKEYCLQIYGTNSEVDHDKGTDSYYVKMVLISYIINLFRFCNPKGVISIYQAKTVLIYIMYNITRVTLNGP